MAALVNLKGQRFGYLTVLRHRGWDGSKNALWVCQCDCGKRHTARGTNLRNGSIQSCGCQRKRLISEAKRKHPMPIEHDDGKDWGFIDSERVWRILPKTPMLLAQLGPPPFDVTLPHTGEVRHIIHNPAEAPPNGRPPEG